MLRIKKGSDWKYYTTVVLLLVGTLSISGPSNSEALVLKPAGSSAHASSRSNADVGYFWHVADLHWDPTYNTSETYPGVSCGKLARPNETLGRYGDYACDSPWTLIDDSIAAMKRIRSDVDFLIWTGDDTPHNANQSMNEVAAIIGNLTDLLRRHFPNESTPIYSVFGNHDWSPKSQLPPRKDPMYETVAEMWSPSMMVFDGEAEETFRKSGYYALWINPNLRIIGLNTNLYYTSNRITDEMIDPGNQLQWLDDILTDTSVHNDSKALLVGHVPPGVFEKHRNYSWYRPHYNRLFLSVLRKHRNVIGSAYFAHHHSDTFRVVRDENGIPVTSFLITPAVTPWETTLPGVMGGAGNNPCVRLVEYNRHTGATIDIHQYYLDLTSANAAPPGTASNWTLEYQFTDYFQVPDVSTASLNDLAERLMTDDDTFQRYYEINDARFVDVWNGGTDAWTTEERLVHYCAATSVDYEAYYACLLKYSSTTTAPTVASTVSYGATTVYRKPLEHLAVVLVGIVVVGLFELGH